MIHFQKRSVIVWISVGVFILFCLVAVGYKEYVDRVKIPAIVNNTLDKVAASDPDLAKSMEDFKNREKILQANTAAIKSDPTSANYFERCNTLEYFFPDQIDDAIADCTEAIRLDPKNKDAYIARSFLYADKGNAAGAIADLKAALALPPSKRSGADYDNFLRLKLQGYLQEARQ
jgi:tetratricopeptide (TPR) repeat protein